MGKRTRCFWLAYFTIEKDKEIFGKGPVGKFFLKLIKELNEKNKLLK